jgi:hypothetical protein
MLKKLMWFSLWVLWAFSAGTALFMLTHSDQVSWAILMLPGLVAMVIAPLPIWLAGRRAERKLANLTFSQQQARTQSNRRFIYWALGIFIAAYIGLWVTMSFARLTQY